MATPTHAVNGADNRSVQRALDILECLREAPTPMRITDIGRATGLGLGTVHRLLATLSRRDYVYQDVGNRRYALGARLAQMHGTRGMVLAAMSRLRPTLTDLSALLGANVYLCLAEGTRVEVLERVVGPPEVAKVASELTRYVDAHATAVGKVMLAHRDPDELRDLYRGIRLRRHTPYTVTSVEDLLQELPDIRAAGFATAKGTFLPGLQAIGIPLHDADRAVHLALSITYLRGAGPALDLHRAVATGQAAAVEIQQLLGRA